MTHAAETRRRSAPSIKAGEIAKARVREALLRHPLIIGRHEAELMAKIEVARTNPRYAERRRDGYDNDQMSVRPGMTIFLNSRHREAYLNEEIEASERIVRTNIGGLWKLDYPKGAYVAGGGIIALYRTVPEDYSLSKDNRMGDDAFSSGYDGLVRIEGAAGERWQNANYHPDGRRRKGA